MAKFEGKNQHLCEKCWTYAKVKAEYQKASGLLQQPKITEWKWGQVGINFVTKPPKTPIGYKRIQIVIDRLSKSAHFVSIK